MGEVEDIQNVAAVLHTRGGLLTEEVVLPAKEPVLKPVPEALSQPLRDALQEQFPKGLFRHQCLAIDLGLQGKNVCLATPTASGKTVAFASIVLTQLLKSPGRVALVLYPAKALVADQAAKWAALAEPLDLAVEIIDGSIPVKDRAERLDSADVVLMTPDVLHAWLLGRSEETANSEFLRELRLVVLDEAHIYEGVFGTNMTYLMRRLRSASGAQQFIASTATLADPESFLQTLVGLPFTAVGAECDGSQSYEKSFCHFVIPARQLQQATRDLVQTLASGHTSGGGKFIAFVDSRKQVEELVAAAVHRKQEGNESTGDAEEEIPSDARVLPYRAGYEEQDRKAIQKSLAHGSLSGVIATSALELGIDIGEVSTVVLVGLPPSVKSFWQRAGRAGRSGAGRVLILDNGGVISAGQLQTFLRRKPEDNWLYLDNEYLQFANVLCAAEEALANKGLSLEPFHDLPKSFLSLLENERKPARPLPNDLYAMKQQAAATRPHLAFPVRTGIEKQYKVIAPRIPGLQLGTLGYSQVLNEAYPGAIYRYMARAYRVYEINNGQSEIRTNRMGGLGRTIANRHAMAFPLYPHGVLSLSRADKAFVFEAKMQVSERVVGFTEVWGSKRTDHKYEVGSSYAQKPLNRHFDSSGVALYVAEVEYPKESCAKYLAIAFCRTCGVHERDIGFGLFSCSVHPLGAEAITGIAIYDSVQGSLRLTRQFMQRMSEIFDEAIQLAHAENANAVARSLSVLRGCVLDCKPVTDNQPIPTIESALGEWIDVVSDGAQAVLHDGASHVNEEVTVLRFAYTPQGPVYFLQSPAPGTTWRVSASLVRAMPGLSSTYKYNINTGETKPGLQ